MRLFLFVLLATFLVSKSYAEEKTSYIISMSSGSMIYNSCVSTVSLSGCERASSVEDLESKIGSATSDLGLDGSGSEENGSEGGDEGGSNGSSTASCASITTNEACNAEPGCIWFRSQCYISGV